MVIRFFCGLILKSDISPMERGDKMKQIILPVILPVILVFAVKALSPQMQTAGIFLLAIMGVVGGIVLNGLIFKNEDSDE